MVSPLCGISRFINIGSMISAIGDIVAASLLFERSGSVLSVSSNVAVPLSVAGVNDVSRTISVNVAVAKAFSAPTFHTPVTPL